MVQNAIVKKNVREGVVEVSLLRQMECGLHCDGACAGCSQRPKEEILALASNPIGAKPGDMVEVEPTGGHNIGTAVVVFAIPCVTLVLGYLAGLAMTLLGLRLTEFVQEALRYMGNLTTPLALIFIGICLYKMDLRHLHLSRDLVLALLGKLVICPLILAGMLHFVELPELMEKVFIIQAGLPCMMQISILGAVYKTDAPFGALLVSLSTVLSVITIPVAMTLLSL